jgi:hypothetical protein
MGAIKWLRLAGEALAGSGIYGGLFHWLARFDTPAAWARVRAEQANAAAHGEFMCVYDALPLLHRPAVNSWLMSTAALWWAAVVSTAGFALLAVTQWRAHRRGHGDEAAASEREMPLVVIAVSLAVMVPFTF